MVININDDRMIMEFLSGRYLGVPDGHTVYMNYPLTGILAWLYKLLPKIDWYGYFLAAVMLLCICLVIYRIKNLSSIKTQKWLYAAAAFGVGTFAMGREFFSVTYTTVAAISGGTAVFWYGTSRGEKPEIMVTALLAALTWCIRDELFLLIVPAAGLIWLFRELPKKEKLWKKFVLPAAVFGSVAVCFLINQWMYSEEAWKDYLKLNELRTEIFDYQDTYYFPNHAEYAEYYERLDLTNEERRMLIYYNFTLVQDEIGRDEVTELFSKMIEYRPDYGANAELLPLGQRIPAEMKQFVKNTVTGAYGKLYNAAVLGFVFLIGWLAARKCWRQAIESFVFLGAGTGLLLVMQIRGRLPDRVVYSLSLILFVTMVLNYLWNRKYLIRPIFLLGVLGCTVFGVAACITTIAANRSVIENEKELRYIQEYCWEREENFYFITGEVLDEYGEVIGSPVKENRQFNYISTGDWISYSPTEEAKLAQKGITSAVEALLNEEQIYLISVKDSANLNYIANYLSGRAGEEISAVLCEDLTEEFGVYKF